MQIEWFQRGAYYQFEYNQLNAIHFHTICRASKDTVNVYYNDFAYETARVRWYLAKEVLTWPYKHYPKYSEFFPRLRMKQYHANQ